MLSYQDYLAATASGQPEDATDIRSVFKMKAPIVKGHPPIRP